MEDIFIKILNMSITASYFALALILIRLVFKKMPKWLSCTLWGLVGLRLILPFSFESILSLIPSNETVPSDIMTSSEPHITSGIPALNSSLNPLINEAFAPEVYASANPLQIVMFILSALWVTGFVALLIYTAVSYFIIRKKTAQSIKDENGAYICDTIDTPFILGIIRPKIYIPSDVSDEDKKLIIFHEKTHIKRLDHLWKPLGFLLLSVHWFNPVMWAAYIFLCRDIEAACDEKVLKENGEEIKKDYSNALINCSAPKKIIRACPLAFGETGVKQRIKNILSYKKPTLWIILIAVITGTLLTLCFMSNPMSTRISDIENNESIFKDVQKLQLYIGSGYIYTTEDPSEELQELKKVKLESTPKDESRDENRDKSYRIELNDSISINIDESFSSLWIDDSVKPSFSYEIKNPEILKNLFSVSNYIKDTAETERDGVYVTLDKINFSKNSTSFEVTWHNETDNVAMYGEVFSIEKFNNNTWEEIPLPENHAFSLIGLILEPHTSVEKTYSFPAALTDEGTYRFSTDYHDKDNTNYFIRAFFSVGTDISDIGGVSGPTAVSTKKNLTLDEVIKFSEKGEELSWEDFDDYSYTETGSGIYIRDYIIDELFYVTIGAAKENEKPLYIRLEANDATEHSSVDIRTADVREFIEEHKNNPVLKSITYSYEGFEVEYSSDIFDCMIDLGGIPSGMVYDSIQYLANVKVTSKEQLNVFIKEISEVTKPVNVSTHEYYFEKYDEEYFNSFSLIIIYSSTDIPVYSFSPQYAYLSESEKTLIIGIEEVKNETEPHTNKEIGYFTLLEVENEHIKDAETINAVLS